MISPINGQHDNNVSEPLPHIEPLFWGTSDLLVWDQTTLFTQLKQNVPVSLQSGGELTPEQFGMAALQLSEGAVDARAVYGYFPVITEHETIVVIDPSDFHSELTILTPRREYRQLVNSLRPDGDIIAFGAATLGSVFSRRCELSENVMERGDAVRKTGEALTALVREKCSMEIRRGMGIPDIGGVRYACEPALENPGSAMCALFEIMSIEERLSMVPETGGIIQPQFSSFFLFLPRLMQSNS